MKVLVTGGARSGKTTYALRRTEAAAPRRFYLATAEPLDDEMADRIARHKAERGDGWSTVEAPVRVAPELRQDGAVMLDCLTLWLTNLTMRELPIRPAVDELVDAIAAVDNPLVVVTNEVGFGIVPDNALSRRFRDELGWLSQRVAAAVDEVWLTVAGCPVRIK